METITETQETFKTIPLTQGQVAIVDAEDYDRLSQLTWQAVWSKDTKSFYARCNNVPRGETGLKMSRVVLGVTDPKIFVDHRNHDTLDHRKQNLRTCTQGQNNQNKRIEAKRGAVVSRFKGVTWKPGEPRRRDKWRARIRVNDVLIHLGYFDEEEDAARAYNEAAIEHFGEFALLNEV